MNPKWTPSFVLLAPYGPEVLDSDRIQSRELLPHLEPVRVLLSPRTRHFLDLNQQRQCLLLSLHAVVVQRQCSDGHQFLPQIGFR